VLSQPPGPPARGARPELGATGPGLPGWLRPVGSVAAALQCLFLVAYSAFLYSRFDLAEDFANTAQAWHQIGHLNLTPVTTIYGIPFIQNNEEFYMWPLGLVGRLYDNAFVLLLLQDVCLALAVWVAWQWWCDLAAEHYPESRPGVYAASGLVLVVLLLSPIIYLAAAFDFHSECVAAPLVVLVGYDLWRGRNRRVLVWAVLLLLVHSLGASYLVAMALAAIVVGKRTTRRIAFVLLGMAAVWFLLMTAVGGVRTGLWSGYAYLTNGNATTVTGGAVLAGALRHLPAAYDVARSRLSAVTRIMVSSGTLGLGSLWGLFPFLVVLGPPVLNSSPLFVSTLISFQFVALVAPMAVGSGWVGLQLYRGLDSVGRRSTARWLRPAGTGVALAVMAAAAVGVVWNIPSQYSTWRSWSSVSSAAAGALSQARGRVPAGAEVIVSSGVAGRFYDARSLYVLSLDSTRFPVCDRDVVFVLTDQGMEGGFTPPAMVAAANSVARSELHAERLVSGNGVDAYLWHPSRGAKQVDLDPSAKTTLLPCG
jgi:hypothetical protein